MFIDLKNFCCSQHGEGPPCLMVKHQRSIVSFVNSFKIGDKGFFFHLGSSLNISAEVLESISSNSAASSRAPSIRGNVGGITCERHNKQ